MSRLGYRLLEGLAIVAVLVGFVAASAAETSVASVLVAGVCAGVVFGVLRFGPPESRPDSGWNAAGKPWSLPSLPEPRDFDLFGHPYDPDELAVSKQPQVAEGRFGR